MPALAESELEPQEHSLTVKSYAAYSSSEVPTHGENPFSFVRRRATPEFHMLRHDSRSKVPGEHRVFVSMCLCTML